MFTYKLPKWNIKLNIKAMSVVATLIYVLTTAPLLLVGFYNWPSADDYSLALETYRSWNNTGNIFATFFTAFRVGLDEYLHWMGYYFSNVMFCYSPSIFGERWYIFVSVWMLGILTFGVYYFFDALFVRALKGDRHLSNIAAMLTLTTIVQCMPEGRPRVEAFYWYGGAINYMFMFGVAMFWLGLMIRTVFEVSPKARFRKLLWACFWGFWLGGANYMTALQCAICSALVIVLVVMHRFGAASIEAFDDGQMKSFNRIWIPACMNLVGFMASCFAPGNATREALVEGFGPIKAILVAILYTYNTLIDKYTRWEVLAAAALMIIISWKLSGTIKHRFEHPFVFTVFALGLSASNMVPPLYALASMEAGRLTSIVYAEYIVLMMLTVFYVTAWARQKVTDAGEAEKVTDKSKKSKTAEPGSAENAANSHFSVLASHMLLIGAAFILFGSALCVYDNPRYYSASSSITDVVSGDAATFLKENQERLAVLKDPDVKDAVLLPYSKKPQMLVFDDITDDKEFWINRVMARYYEKESVVLGGSD